MDGELEKEQGAAKGEQVDGELEKEQGAIKESGWTVNWRKSRVQ